MNIELPDGRLLPIPLVIEAAGGEAVEHYVQQYLLTTAQPAEPTTEAAPADTE